MSTDTEGSPSIGAAAPPRPMPSFQRPAQAQPQALVPDSCANSFDASSLAATAEPSMSGTTSIHPVATLDLTASQVGRAAAVFHLNSPSIVLSDTSAQKPAACVEAPMAGSQRSEPSSSRMTSPLTSPLQSPDQQQMLIVTRPEQRDADVDPADGGSQGTPPMRSLPSSGHSSFQRSPWRTPEMVSVQLSEAPAAAASAGPTASPPSAASLAIASSVQRNTAEEGTTPMSPPVPARGSRRGSARLVSLSVPYVAERASPLTGADSDADLLRRLRDEFARRNSIEIALAVRKKRAYVRQRNRALVLNVCALCVRSDAGGCCGAADSADVDAADVAAAGRVGGIIGAAINSAALALAVFLTWVPLLFYGYETEAHVLMALNLALLLAAAALLFTGRRRQSLIFRADFMDGVALDQLVRAGSSFEGTRGAQGSDKAGGSQ